MNPYLAELLHGAGIGDIIIPKKEFKEHHHLVELLNRYDIPALHKEAKDHADEMKGGTHRQDVLKKYKLEDRGYSLQELSDKTSIPLSILQEVYNRGIGAYRTSPKSVRLKGSYVKNVDAPMSKKLSKEQWAMARVYSFINGNPSHDEDLRSNKGGKVKCGKKSGFIRRLMAENALKHEGQYKNPTFPLHPRSTMFHQAEFKYKDLANVEQDGNRESEYGASPFIIKHFGQAEPVPFERKRGVAPPSEPYGRPRGEPQESEEQREARRGFVEKKAEAKPEPSKEEAKEVVKHSTSAKVKPAPVAKDEVDEKYGAEGDRTGDAELPKGFLPLADTNKSIKNLIDNNQTLRWNYVEPPARKKAFDRLYKSMRFHLMNGENVRQFPPEKSHFAYSGFEDWIRENHRDETKMAYGEDGWALLYIYGVFDKGRWRLKTDADVEADDRQREISRRRDLALMEQQDAENNARIKRAYEAYKRK